MMALLLIVKMVVYLFCFFIKHMATVSDLLKGNTVSVSCTCCFGKKRRQSKLDTMAPKSRSEVHNQLEVFHYPFSRATQQPKIPDGKTVESLGYRASRTTEIVNEEKDNAEGAQVIHILLFAGMNAGLLCQNVLGAPLDTVGNRNYLVIGAEDANSPSWVQTTPATGASGIAALDNYHSWRVVSTGARFSLLNPDEENDGWWEAVRITEEHRSEDWYLTTLNLSQNTSGNGVLAPVELLNKIDSMDMSIERSYCTGLLRDIENYEFSLNGVQDHHDFRKMKDRITLESDLTAPAGTADYIADSADFDAYQARLVAGRDNCYDLIDNYVDNGYDMIYIRVHPRHNRSDISELNGSRLHVEWISNQEIVYGHTERESRFQTLSGNVGVDSSSRHASLRRLRGLAAHKVV